MHSSRMHTARSLTASCSIHGVAGGRAVRARGGMHGRGACVPGGACMAGGHVRLGACMAVGCACWGGMCGPCEQNDRHL